MVHYDYEGFGHGDTRNDDAQREDDDEAAANATNDGEKARQKETDQRMGHKLMSVFASARETFWVNLPVRIEIPATVEKGL